MFAEVPVLPVVVPIALVALAVFSWSLGRRRLLTPGRFCVALALCLYVAGVVANTVFPIYLDKPSRAGWDAFNLIPLVDYEAADALMNTGVFLPLGVLLSLAVPTWRWWRVVMLAGAFSAGIEVSQYLTARLSGGGHVADVNDFLFNIAGAALGCAVLGALSRVPIVARLVDRFRWAPPKLGDTTHEQDRGGEPAVRP